MCGDVSFNFFSILPKYIMAFAKWKKSESDYNSVIIFY